MTSTPSPAPRGLIRRLLPFTTIISIAAVGYCAWVFYSRWAERREAQQAVKAVEAREADRVTKLLGGDELKILSFYASPTVVSRGGQGLLCYGVANAKKVTIEPFSDAVSPSLSRCLAIQPARTTEYKLTAQDAAGHSQTALVTVQVQ